MKEQEIYEKAMVKFGTKRQLYKLAEECGELIQSIIKYNDEPADPYKVPDELFNLLGEMADVDILLRQMRLDFDWIVQKKAKLERLEKLLEEV